MKDNRVLCVMRNDMPAQWLIESYSQYWEEKKLNDLFRGKMIWVDRQEAELNTELKQLIPYLVLQLPDKRIACYMRNGNESRLHGLWSAGVGGHIDFADSQNVTGGVMEIARKGARRELNEELSDLHAFDCSFLGVINEEITKVGRVHTGFVFIIRLEKPAMPEKELYDLEWLPTNDILKRKTEIWTRLALGLIC